MMESPTALMRILTASVLIALAGTAAAQQTYPAKPIRFITPYAPGGTTTLLVRLIGQKLTETWGQQVIVDNRPGGNTIIGSEALVKAPPDGYTILLVSTTHVTTPLLVSTPYDAITDFAPVATVAVGQHVLVLHPAVPASNLQQLITLAKAKPGELNYASAGSGSVGHLSGEFFSLLAGVKIQQIPYKGTGPALIDLVSGQVQMLFSPPMIALPHIKSGKLKAIAVDGEARLSALPQVPTFTEGGLPGFDMQTWYGVLAPAGTPKEIIDKLSREIGKIVATPDYKEKMVSQGQDSFIRSADQFGALITAEMAKYARIIKAANIKLK